MFHLHRPAPTGITIKAGFRKNNLPPGNYLSLSIGQLHICRCKKKFIDVGEGRLMEIENEGALAQYDRAGNN